MGPEALAHFACDHPHKSSNKSVSATSWEESFALNLKKEPEQQHVICKYLYILTIDLLLSTDPNSWQTRPLVREGAPQKQL
jgi:hypothetical protein